LQCSGGLRDQVGGFLLGQPQRRKHNDFFFVVKSKVGLELVVVMNVERWARTSEQIHQGQWHNLMWQMNRREGCKQIQPQSHYSNSNNNNNNSSTNNDEPTTTTTTTMMN
jgi:hypothetical protein